MSQFLHNNDTKVIRIPPAFSENRRAKKLKRDFYLAYNCPVVLHTYVKLCHCKIFLRHFWLRPRITVEENRSCPILVFDSYL